MFIATYIFSLFDSVPDPARILVFITIFLIYDPLLTTAFGGTIGHMLIGIRVKRESNNLKNISFPFAVLRYVIKAILGIISFLTVAGNEKRKAIHDYAAGSIVIYIKPDKTN
jgi:uncharacterized RDD family membrane protein YckC